MTDKSFSGLEERVKIVALKDKVRRNQRESGGILLKRAKLSRAELS